MKQREAHLDSRTGVLQQPSHIGSRATSSSSQYQPTRFNRDMSTEPDPILAAIAAINAREPGDCLMYRAAAKIFGCDKETLRRRHQNKQRTNAEAHKDAMLLHPQQKLELVHYIQGLSKRGLAPTRNMIQNFASEVAKWEVSMA
jgi:hypothetical protein